MKEISFGLKFKDAIPKMMKYLGIKTQRELAHHLEFEASNISNYKHAEKGKETVPVEWLIKFLLKNNLPLEFFWGSEIKEHPAKYGLAKRPDWVVPYGAEAGEKFGILFEYIKSWIDEIFPAQQRRDLRTLIVRADNMEPTLPRRSFVVVDTADIDIQEDGLFAFKIGESIKYFRVHLRKDGRLEMINDNRVYETEIIDVETFESDPHMKVIGRVIFRGNKL